MKKDTQLILLLGLTEALIIAVTILENINIILKIWLIFATIILTVTAIIGWRGWSRALEGWKKALNGWTEVIEKKLEETEKKKAIEETEHEPTLL